MGPEFILLNLSVDFTDTLSVGDMEDTISTLDRHIKQTYPKIKRVFIEAEAPQTKSISSFYVRAPYPSSHRGA
jgi:hypothetical protein